jgi:hypothetical protein
MQMVAHDSARAPAHTEAFVLPVNPKNQATRASRRAACVLAARPRLGDSGSLLLLHTVAAVTLEQGAKLQWQYRQRPPGLGL